MPLGERIRELRTELKWSQGELASRINADAAQISRYEHAKMTPSADILVRIAEALDVSCDYLLVEDAPRRPFRARDRHLGDRLASVDELTDEDLALVLSFIDALVTKTRLKHIVGEVA